MSIDERLRAELTRAVAPSSPREDDALDHVWRQHRRGLVRTRVVRQATAAAVVVSLFASAALIVAWRNVPDRFRSTATVRVAPKPPRGPTTTTASGVSKLSDPRKLALAPATRRATLVSAHLPPDDTRVDFRATLNSTRDLLSLIATAPSGNESAAVTRQWGLAFAKARRADAIRALRERNRALDRRIAALHQRLNAIDAELVRINPARYHPPFTAPPAHAPEQGSTHELNVANERVQVLAELARIGAESARNGITILSPRTFSSVVAQTPAVRVDTSSPATLPILVGWAIGLVVVLAAAAFAYRRRTRSMRQVVA